MFLTQTNPDTFKKKYQTPAPSLTLQRSKSAISRKYSKLVVKACEKESMQLKKAGTSTCMARCKEFRYTNPERKWNKIVDLFNLPEQPPAEEEQKQVKALRPCVTFYNIFVNSEMLKKYQVKINFPETYMEVNGDLIEIRTNEVTGIVQSRKIQRENYAAIMGRCLERQILKVQKFPTKYKKHYDYRYNGFAPVIVTKTADEFDQSFDVDIEHYKNFNERRSRPSGNKLVQRFIYSRNMKAMIMRICYKRKKQTEQRQQFCAYRFQNVDNIFRANKKNSEIYETFKAQSTLSATYTRQDKIEYSKLTNMKGLQKYIFQSKQLITFLQKSQKIKISEILIDFIVDLLDVPWVINLKKIQYQDNINNCMSLHVHYGKGDGQGEGVRESVREKSTYRRQDLEHAIGGFGVCRLCSCQYLKVFLKKTISNKMLWEFLEHLRKRMKASEYDNIEFIREIIKKNTKNYITLQVCEGCYRLVAEQFKLIEAEKQLAKICNIETEQDLYYNEMRNRSLNVPQNLKQWRLMLYFVGISNIPHQLFKDEEDIVLRYRLGSIDGIEHSWKIKTLLSANSSSFNGNFKLNLNIKKIKIHYFYSESLNIDNFLKQTEISLQLATLSTQKIFAKGSSGILSSFGRQFSPDLCLRQTSSMLLFYNSGEYCQMTFKIGIICDGAYNLPQNTSLKPINKVYFSDNSFRNSNPIPQEWMEAFGVSQDLEDIEGVGYEDVIKPKIDVGLRELIGVDDSKKKDRKRTGLARKSMHLFR